MDVITTMEKISSSQFRDDFGRVMDNAQHSSITITKRGRDFMTLFSQKKIDNAKSLLWDYPRQLVESGEMDIIEALTWQIRISQDMEEALKQYENGQCYEATDEFFDSIKIEAQALADKQK